jgi:hypothetical protein
MAIMSLGLSTGVLKFGPASADESNHNERQLVGAALALPQGRSKRRPYIQHFAQRPFHLTIRNRI